MIRSALFLLFLAALIFFQPSAAWSVLHLHGLSIFPVLIGGVLFAFFFVKRLPDGFSRFLNRTFSGRFFWISSILILGAGMSLLLFFRFRLFLPPPQGSGDSLLLLEHVPAYSRIFGFLDSFDEVLDLYVHSRMYLTARSYGFYVEDVYAWTSFAAGFAYTAALLFFLRGRPFKHALLGFGLLYFSPGLQLYAGYVENYSLASVCVSISLFIGVRLLERTSEENRISPFPILVVAVIAALGALFHLLGSPVLFALVYLVWILSGKKFRRFLLWSACAATAALLVLIPAWAFFLTIVENPVSFGASFTASPAILRPSRFFSVSHGLDLLNLLLFASPAGLFLVAARYGASTGPQGVPGGSQTIGMKISGLLGGPPGIFPAIAATTYFVHASIWNSHIGFPADWDLFTFFQGPFNLLVFHIAALKDTKRPHADQPIELRWTAAPLLLGFFFTLPWLARNASDSDASRRNKEKARANVEDLVREIERDPLFPAVTGLAEKRNYVKVKLFRIRCLRALEDDKRPDSVKKALRLDLEKATREYERLMIPRSGISDTAARKIVWDELTRLNLEINGARD